jgi:sec-independent protein translocase protein TatA
MNAMLAIMGMGGGELVLVLVVILILFGAKRIPEFAKGLGQGIKEFKKASNEVTTEFHNAMTENPAPPSPARPAAPPAPSSAPSAPTATVPKA